MKTAGALVALFVTSAVVAGEQPESGADPLRLRKALLERLDARITSDATRAHLEARLLLDEVLPVPYVGFDADPVEGGMKVTKIYPGTGAEKAGLAPGDIVAAVEGEATSSAEVLGRRIRRHRPGDRLELRILRGGREEALSVTLGRRPEEDEDEEEQFPELREEEAPATAAARWEFESLDAFEGVLGGHGKPGRWSLLGETGARFLRQEEGDATGIRFPMLLVRERSDRDVGVRVRFRLTGGGGDRAAGIVLHYRDPGNYLVARVNAIEGDLRIFRVVNGLRRTLPGGKVPVACDAEWHLLEFRAEGAKLTASVDGGSPATSYDTFFLRGAVGLWTKSDSVTDFDDLEVLPVAPPR